ncbi:hypothetical protein OIDMADRAFT_46746 [Oidiodendron maius Zn]|uniref:Uncharacterized protein n=1 Tax=Oidiodendron maius (strain Zn) TaxID=913774 RepID=A0A0C3HF09_OIDMZ|nr:hypothetical protein OIDMADRAFT_46746 [Oidiodendron maius Zn]
MLKRHPSSKTGNRALPPDVNNPIQRQRAGDNSTARSQRSSYRSALRYIKAHSSDEYGYLRQSKISDAPYRSLPQRPMSIAIEQPNESTFDSKGYILGITVFLDAVEEQ